MLCTMLLFLTASLFSQQKNTQSLSRQDYLEKSKKQKTAAWILLGGGAVLIGTGLLIGDRQESSFDNAATGGIIAGIGIASAIGSIPFFIASARNKRKVVEVSTYLEIQQNPVCAITGLNLRSYPALSIKINF